MHVEIQLQRKNYDTGARFTQPANIGSQDVQILRPQVVP